VPATVEVEEEEVANKVAAAVPGRASAEAPEGRGCGFCWSCCERVEDVAVVEGRMEGRIIELERVAAAALEALMLYVCVCLGG
jgi:hypothetical protein